MRGASIVFALAFSGALCAAAAERRSPPLRRTETVVVLPVQYCEKMCPQDFAPCDPPYFKTADARCAQVGAGR
ncbi:hypothetical protein MSC49_11870 [Methylosinus sp. C49]|nr:hypothetical protein MSC49_11870 [Methylosinus sp. C49]